MDREDVLAKIKILSNDSWSILSEVDSEIVVNRENDEAIVRARTAPFIGSVQDLKSEFTNRIKSDSIILNARNDAIDCNGELWFVMSFVCTNSEKYRYFFYRIYDRCYTVIEMMSNIDTTAVKFVDWAKELISLMEIQNCQVWNPIEINGEHLEVRTPSTFRFSTNSTKDRLIFLGENKYLVVNVSTEEFTTLKDMVHSKILVRSEPNVIFDAEYYTPEFELCRYRVEGEDCNTYCTYFRKVYDSVEIIAFLYEAGECKTDVESLLSVRRCSNE